ncbi:MAG: oligosaccharide flippase family protein [Candidatus Bathyarchaeota archaeon]|nr:oligosaccharide flippase family protein [Candidatus Bathyarchaeota archaeon]
MTKNQIRVQYSGFIIFSSQIISIATGLVFTLLLTRNMNTAEFGIWTNIFDYTSYFALFSGVLPFWATRFMAREKVGTVKTSTLAQLSMALISTIVYFPAIVMITNAIHTQAYLAIYFIAGWYIFNFYMVAIFESVLRSMRPQVIGYGLLIEEAVKVAIAVTLIVGFGELFLGAILGLVVSAFVQILYYVWILRDQFKEHASWSYLKEWFKGSVAIAYNLIGGQLVSFVMVLMFYYAGSNTRAYYQAAFTFTTIIGYSASLAFALYPKLLSKSCPEEQVGDSLRTVLMLAIPLSTIVIAMATSFLTILDIDYAVAWPVVIVLTIDTLVVLIYQFYSSCLMGTEGFDAAGKISLHQLVKSKIFKVFTVPYIQAAIALPLAYYVLTRFAVVGTVQAVVYVVLITLGVHLSTFIGFYTSMHRSIRLHMDWAGIAKFITASVLMAVVLLLLPTPTTLVFTITKAVMGLAIYIGLLLAIDKQARKLFNLIVEEINGTIKALTGKTNSFLDKSPSQPSEN